MAQVQEGQAFHGSAFLALEQTAGKGQRGRTWHAAPGENITISYVIEPGALNITAQFLVSAAASLGCYHFLNKYAGSDCSVKWPNDLYWNDRKAGGILIENVIRGTRWLYSVIGIGININQTQFEPASVKPVSLKQITGKHFDILQLVDELSVSLSEFVNKIATHPGDIMAEYNEVLYRRGQLVRLEGQQEMFEARIESVDQMGRICVSNANHNRYQIGEVRIIV